MAILKFTLSEDGVLVFHDVLACVAKFSEDVCLEARKDKVSVHEIGDFFRGSWLINLCSSHSRFCT
jgi:hypothetical protein